MGLDLHVLPLWRYFAGRFQGPTEAFGAVRIGAAKPDAPEQRARERVTRLRLDLERRLGHALIWRDEGDVALSEQYDYCALQAIRAFAAHQDHPARHEFTIDPEHPHDHLSLRCVYELDAPTRYPHLIDHSDCFGFYLPCDFPSPLPYLEIVEAKQPETGDGAVEEEDVDPAVREFIEKAIDDPDRLIEFFAGVIGGKDAVVELRQDREARKRSVDELARQFGFPPRQRTPLPVAPEGKAIEDWHKVGSAVRLLAELEDLKHKLGMSRDWGDLKSGETLTVPEDPLGLVKYGWGLLHYAARVSVTTGLPIVFDG